MADVIKLASNSQRLSHPLLNSLSSSLNSCQRALPRSQSIVSVSDSCFVSPIVFRPRKKLGNFKNPFVTFWRVSKTLASGIRAKVLATVTETEQPKWWERNAGPNMVDIHSTQELLTALSEAGERLVIVEFYGTWCASCRALFPKFCRTAQEHPDILFLKVNFDENKPMCKSLNVKVLPYFHFYRGADGQLESFSCSLAKFQKIKDAIQRHNTDRCSIGPPKGLGDMDFEGLSSPKEKLPESSAA